jgi:hypothetical protein
MSKLTVLDGTDLEQIVPDQQHWELVFAFIFEVLLSRPFWTTTAPPPQKKKIGWCQLICFCYSVCTYFTLVQCMPLVRSKLFLYTKHLSYSMSLTCFSFVSCTYMKRNDMCIVEYLVVACGCPFYRYVIKANSLPYLFNFKVNARGIEPKG